jgi:hypothetical protein
MATQIGLSTGEIIPLGQFSASQDQQGGWTATRQYYMLAATFASTTVANQFAPGSPAIVADSTIPAIFSFLVVESRSVQYGEAGTCTVTVNYTGAAGAQYDEGSLSTGIESTYRLECRLIEVPLSEHPKWKALGEQEQSSLGLLLGDRIEWLKDPFDAGYALWWPRTSDQQAQLPSGEQLTSADAIAFADLIGASIKTYFVPTITWTETTQGNEGMTAAQLNLLGKISTPRGGPPNASGGRDWMLTSASQEQRGELYQTTIEWTLSEREGWDAFLYS